MEFEAVVCIPTFRRPQSLQRTLDSLVAQVGGTRFCVVVAENDAARQEGKAVADAMFASRALDGVCVVETEQGNCAAINRAFRTARDRFPDVEFIMMIDDDEVASPSWISLMVRTARESGADLVGGAVLRDFEQEPPPRRLAHPLFNPTMTRNGPVPSLHGTGNCLMRRKVFDALGEPSFDMRFNFLGGGDMDFFTRARDAGFTAYWINEAFATESVPEGRTSVEFMLKRSIGIGAVNYTIDRKRRQGAAGAAYLLAKNLATLGVAAVRGVLVFARTGDWLRASYPLCLSIGRNMAWFGYTLKPYKAKPRPAPAADAASPDRPMDKSREARRAV